MFACGTGAPRSSRLIARPKSIADGLPLSAVTSRTEIMNATVGGLGGTFGGNPVAC